MSVDRGEALSHTASPTRRWLLIEQPGAWGVDAARESGLDPELGGAAAKEMTSKHGRMLLIRRPARQRAGAAQGVRRWLAFDSTWSEGFVRGGTFDDDDEVVDLARAMNAPGSEALGASRPGDLVLVCTHGKHDACCAEAGRDACRSLGDLGTEDLWECSHIGGDRFAGNILLLPHGMYFGRVDANAAAAFDLERRERRLLLEHYRGRATVSRYSQVAEDCVRRDTGLLGFDEVLPVSEVQLEQHHHRVTVLAGDGRVEVDVRRLDDAVSAFLTCRSERESEATAFEARIVAD
ncbi:MAG TPA: sucrase ferredoxin [Microthrixaceae bacterium]|nr:sucrase ferredoxin [Microthrixaceae bacterium]